MWTSITPYERGASSHLRPGVLISHDSSSSTQPTLLNNDVIDREGISVARARYFLKKPHEVNYSLIREEKERITFIPAMDWLFDHGIVFNMFPDSKVVKEIVDSDLRTQILACLTFLEHKPEQESASYWRMFFTILLASISFILGQTWPSEAPLLEALQTPSVIWSMIIIAVTLLLIILVAAENRNAKSVAAWALSWSTAIKEYEPAPERKTAGINKSTSNGRVPTATDRPPTARNLR